MATALWASEAFTDQTIVCIGTSPPGLIASTIAGIRNERDSATGKPLGAVTFNVSIFGAVAAVVALGGIDFLTGNNTLGTWSFLAGHLLLIPVLILGKNISRLGRASFHHFFVALSSKITFSNYQRNKF